jgi:hypothetical protein
MSLTSLVRYWDSYGKGLTAAQVKSDAQVDFEAGTSPGSRKLLFRQHRHQSVRKVTRVPSVQCYDAWSRRLTKNKCPDSLLGNFQYIQDLLAHVVDTQMLD